MTRTALYVSMALLVGTAGAFAQTESSSQPSTNPPPAAATQAPSTSGSASQSSQAEPAAPAGQQTAANQACAQDAAKYCSGKIGAERQDCLEQNDAKLSDACKQAMATQTAPAH